MSPAHLYHWRSEALKQYGLGHLIASAHTAETARTIIRANAAAHYTNDRYYFDPDDADDREDLAKFIAKVETDLTAEPTVSDCLFIDGSE